MVTILPNIVPNPSITPQGGNSPMVAPVAPTQQQIQNRTEGGNQNNAFDTQGNPVQVGNLSLNPQFTTTPPKSSTVISSTGASDAINNNNKTITNYSKSGLNLGADGIARNADGTLATPPSTATQSMDEQGNISYSYNGVKYGKAPDLTLDPISQKANDMYANWRADFDARIGAQIDSIHSKYQNLIVQQQDINQRYSAGVSGFLLSAGSLGRSASSEAIMATSYSYGLGKIHDLQQQENDAVLAAQNAQSEGDFKAMDAQLKIAQDSAKEKNTEIQKLNETLVKAQQDMADQQKQADKASSIADAINNKDIGADPTKILSALKGNGLNINADDIKKVMDTIAKNTGGTAQQVSNGVEAFWSLKRQVGGLPTDILAMPDTSSQLFEFLKRYNTASAVSKTGTGLFTSAPSADTDVQTIADAIVAGRQPPTVTGLYGKTAAVRAALEERGFDYSKANQDWTATQKLLSTMNGAQQTRLRQAINFTSDSLDLMSDLNKDAENAMSRAGITAFASVQRKAAMQGVFGQEIKSAFTKLDNQVSDLVSELATVYKGGNSSTDESLKLAAKQLDSNWDYKTFKDNIELVRKNLAIRKNSINLTVGGIENSQYNPMPSLGESKPTDILNFFSTTTPISNLDDQSFWLK